MDFNISVWYDETSVYGATVYRWHWHVTNGFQSASGETLTKWLALQQGKLAAKRINRRLKKKQRPGYDQTFRVD